MDDTYRFLRQVEHRLQILFDRQTHEMPRDPEAVRTLALRMGYAPASAWEERNGPAARFMADYRSKTELNRRILNHLLHDAFSGDAGQAVDPIVDLVLDPEPSAEFIKDVLGTLSVPRSLDGLSQSDGFGPRRFPVLVAGPLPALPGGDRAAADGIGRAARPTRT